MFTKQLFRSKRRALVAYREHLSARSHQVEHETMGTTYACIDRMRVVPLDLRSFGQLVGSTLGAIATLLPLLYETGELATIFDALGRFVGHATGN